MKKRPNLTNVRYLDQKTLNCRNISTGKKYMNNLIEMMTCCEICNSKTTKKNYVNGLYLCEDCESLSASEIYTKIADDFENKLKKEVQNYINWDEEDLDHLYYMVWCDNEPTNDTKR